MTDKDTGWRLGQTSERYETGGRGASTISTGRGDLGGASYGAYQLSSRMGTLAEYLGQSRYGEAFTGLTPATAAFDVRWRELANTDPGFARDQHDFIKRTHYDVQVERLQAAGVDLSGRGPAVQDALWSTSVQFRNLTRRIVTEGLEESFGAGYDVARLSDRDIVGAMQDYKIRHNEVLFRRSPRLWPGLLERARSERNDLVEMAERRHAVDVQGDDHQERRAGRGTLDDTSHRVDGNAPVLRQGNHGERVVELQRALAVLDVRDASDRALATDGDFGARTRQAVEAFQRSQGLDVDGQVGHDTWEALSNERSAVKTANRTRGQDRLLEQARDGIERLPEAAFAGDGERANAAAALASASRARSLSRIDHVVLAGADAGFIAVQGALHDPAHRRVYVDRAQAVNPQIEQLSLGERAVRTVPAPDRERVEVGLQRTDEEAARERQCPVL